MKNLQLFLDCAETDVWKDLIPTGLFSGITTNPSLILKSNQTCNHSYIKDLANQAEELGCNELHLQAWGETYQEIFDCGVQLGELATDSLKIYVKVPITKPGCKAGKSLVALNYSITLTACFETPQVLIAEALKASYIAPYLGRINQQGKKGFAEILTMKKILEELESECKILVASIKSIDELIQLSKNGLRTFTLSPLLAEELLNIELSLQASKQFNADAMNSL